MTRKLFQTAKRNLAKVRNYQPGKPIKELQREAGIREAIKMASNENALGPSPKAIRAIRKSLKGIHRYPEGGCYYLRQKLSKRLGVSPESLVFGNGSDELLIFVMRAFIGKSDTIVIADPTFLVYEIACQVEDGRVVKVPMKQFRYDLEGMAKRINARTKAVFIANPDNPVGTYVKQGELLRFLKKVPKRVLVVLDEAYYEFASKQKDYPESIKLLKKFKNIIITRTFSKAYGLSGLRIGFAITSSEIAQTLEKVREPFNVNLLAQEAALAALDDRAHLKKTLQSVAVGRRYLLAEFKKMNLETVQTVTNFVLVDLKIDARKIYNRLLKRGVIVRAMTAWGLDHFLRVTIGTPNENKKFIQALKLILKK